MAQGYLLDSSLVISRYFHQLGPFNASLLIAAFVVLGMILLLVFTGDVRPVHKYGARSRPAVVVLQWLAIGSLFAFAWHFYDLGEDRRQAQLVANRTVPRIEQPQRVELPQSINSMPEPASERCSPCTGPQFIQSREFVLIRQPDSHFYAQTSIAGMRALFVVDTGATTVSMPLWMAPHVGAQRLQSGVSSTANGVTQVWTGVVPEMTVEGATLRNVEVTFMPNLPGAPLLGQSALKQFNIEQRNDRLYFHALSL